MWVSGMPESESGRLTFPKAFPGRIGFANSGGLVFVDEVATPRRSKRLLAYAAVISSAERAD